MSELIISLFVSFLLGGLPTSIFAGRLLKGIDIREHGSGNAGATNVYRVLGPIPAIIVLLIDAGKGVLSVMLIASWIPAELLGGPVNAQVLCGLVAMMGHSFPVWAGFKGGKGIGTAAGVMISIIPIETMILLAIFILIVATTRYVSLGSIASAMILLLIMLVERFIMGRDVSYVFLGICIFLCAFIIYSHRANIRRLMAGTENRLGEKANI